MNRYDAERIKRNADIADVVGQYGVQLKQSGSNELVGLCPFHDENTPSFTVNTEKQIFYCFGCSAGSDVFDFIMRIDSLTAFSDAVVRVAELTGQGEPATLPPGGPPKSRPARHVAAAGQSNSPAAAESVDKVPGQIVDIYQYTDESGELLYEVVRIEPGDGPYWLKAGDRKSFRQRHSDGNGGYTWALDGVRRVLYRLPRIAESSVIWVVEGEKDVHSLEAVGLVATTNSGGAGQKWQPEWTSVFSGKTVIIVPDNDEPGRKRAAIIAKEISGVVAEMVVVSVPDGKDVSDFFAAGHTVTELLDIAATARRNAKRDAMERRGLLNVPEILDLVEGGIGAFVDPSIRHRGIPTGFARLDEMTLGMFPGHLLILAARPSMGKTALALDIAAHAAEHKYNVGIFSMEMSRESLLTRLVCARARTDQLRFQAGYLDKNERQAIDLALYEISQMPIFIDDGANTSLETLSEKLHRHKAAGRGLDLVIVDYLQLMKHSGRENRNQEVNALSRGLKLMAREFDVPFLVLSQLSRGPDQRQGDHKPQLSDLRDSGGIEQDADLVAFIYREEVYKRDREDLKGLAELIIAKQRNGPIGNVKLTFIQNLAKFEMRAADQE